MVRIAMSPKENLQQIYLKGGFAGFSHYTTLFIDFHDEERWKEGEELRQNHRITDG